MNAQPEIDYATRSGQLRYLIERVAEFRNADEATLRLMLDWQERRYHEIVGPAIVNQEGLPPPSCSATTTSKVQDFTPSEEEPEQDAEFSALDSVALHVLNGLLASIPDDADPPRKWLTEYSYDIAEAFLDERKRRKSP